MKLYIFIFSLNILITGFTVKSYAKENPEILFTSILKGSYFLPEDGLNDSIIYFLVECNIINKSDSTVSFTTHSCSIPAYVVTDNNEIKVCQVNCAGNFIKRILLNPYESFSFHLILRTRVNCTNRMTRIGWVFLVHPTNMDSWEYSELLMKSKNRFENIIWSNPLELKTSLGIPYRIYSDLF